jgi:hypothetical protein
MRGIRAICATLALCATALPAVAQAGTAVSIAPSFSPDRLGGLAAFTIKAHLANEQGGVPAPVSQAVVQLPAGFTVDLRGVSVCSRAGVSSTSCPASAKVGTGSAVAEAHLGSETIPEAAAVSAYRGPNHNGFPTLEVAGQGLTPLIERVVVVGTIEPDQRPYGLKMVLSIPAIPTLPTEPNASIVNFSLTLRAAHHGLVHIPSSCPVGGFPFAAALTFAEGSSSETTATAPCP